MMMKMTFEGSDPRRYPRRDARGSRKVQAEHARYHRVSGPVKPAAPVAKPVAKPVEKPVYTQMTKPVPEKKARTEKQLANDEKMRVAALERVAAKRAAKAAVL